ncbi:hypothetical protein E2651_32475 [Streptomyces sp. MZ04]|nr:hypothetical protein E2651_32475 [Streptomyces sp. MZ04]
MKWSSRTGWKCKRIMPAPATDGLRAVWFLAPPGLRTSPTRSKFCHSHWESAKPMISTRPTRVQGAPAQRDR